MDGRRALQPISAPSRLVPHSRTFRSGIQARGWRPVKCRAEADPDFITKVFGKLFGKAALEDQTPFGMKRMAQEEMDELYPATTTEFAEPIEADDAIVSLFRPLLAKTRLEKLSLRVAYDANRDGWNSRALHERVDGYGAAVVLAKTSAGSILGGYNPQGWIGLSEERDSNAAFLFSWPDGNVAHPAVKLPKVGGPNLAVLDGADNGIQFGAEGLTIGLRPGQERLAKSRLGSYYAKHPDLPSKGRSLFVPDDSGKAKAELTELQVYVAEGGPEEWNLDGIVWKSKDGQQ